MVRMNINLGAFTHFAIKTFYDRQAYNDACLAEYMIEEREALKELHKRMP